MYFHSIILILDDPCISCVPVSLSGSKGMDSISTTSRVRFKNHICRIPCLPLHHGLRWSHQLQHLTSTNVKDLGLKCWGSHQDRQNGNASEAVVLLNLQDQPRDGHCTISTQCQGLLHWQIQGLEMSSAKQMVCVAPNHWACSYVWIAVKACWGCI